MISVLIMSCLITSLSPLISLSNSLMNKPEALRIQTKGNIIRKNLEEMSFVQFLDSNYTDFTHLKILTHFTQDYIFLVTKKSYILQLNILNLQIMNVFQPYPCYMLSSSCQKRVTITHISSVNYRHFSLMYFCYLTKSVSSVSSSLSSQCVLSESAKSNPILIRWPRQGFISTTPSHLQVEMINTASYTFSGSYVSNHPIIYRSRIPNLKGDVTADAELETQSANFYFEKDSYFIGSFQTKYEVFFIIVESLNETSATVGRCSRHSIWRDTNSKHGNESDYKEESNRPNINQHYDGFQKPSYQNIQATRLIRICKDDPGGEPNFNQKQFATFAKTELECPIDVSVGGFMYKRALAAQYVNRRLFVLFNSQINGPQSGVVCVYNINDVLESFAGPTKSPWTEVSCFEQDRLENKPNPLPTICQKLFNKNLSQSELNIARGQSINNLYRMKNVSPASKMPLIKLGSSEYNNIKVFCLSDDTYITIVYCDHKLKLFNYREGANICQQDLVFSEKPITGVVFMENDGIWVFISTKYSIEKLNLNICGQYMTRVDCWNNAPQYCGWWSVKKGKCTLWKEKDWKRSKGGCNKSQFQSTLSDPQHCQVREGGLRLNCLCQYRKNHQQDNKVEISNCSGSIKLERSRKRDFWSKCSVEGVQTRRRHCSKDDKCFGMTDEIRLCKENKLNEFKSSWTKWIRQTPNSQIYEKYRAVCSVNKTVQPMIEKRERRVLLKDDWSDWSLCFASNIRYRLRGCRSLLTCPRDRIHMTVCSSKSPSIVPIIERTTSTKYTLIHLILAILIASITWLMVVVLVTVILYRRQIKSYSNSPSATTITTTLNPSTLMSVSTKRSASKKSKMFTKPPPSEIITTMSPSIISRSFSLPNKEKPTDQWQHTTNQYIVNHNTTNNDNEWKPSAV